MGLGIGLVLIGAGAIITFATDLDTPALNVTAIGVIMMLVGATSMVLTLIYTRPRAEAPVVEVLNEARTFPERKRRYGRLPRTGRRPKERG